MRQERGWVLVEQFLIFLLLQWNSLCKRVKYV